MTVVFESVGSAVTWTSGAQAALLIHNPPVVNAGPQIAIAVFGFSEVASGSGPYIDSADSGWSRALYQAPSDTGSGIEVWVRSFNVSGFSTFNFIGNQNAVARAAAFRCDDGESFVTVDAVSTAQHTGDNPVLPSVTTINPDSELIGVLAHIVDSSGWFFPAGWAKRIEDAHSGNPAFVRIGLEHITKATPGASGTVTVTGTAPSASTKGVTGMLALSCNKMGWTPHIYRRVSG